MEYDICERLPAVIQVAGLVSSRYGGGGAQGGPTAGARPQSWGSRRAGTDTVRTVGGRVLRLASDGSQSPPRPGWVLVLRGGDAEQGYLWTLYGFGQS